MNIFLKEVGLTKCKKCKKSILPHVACFNCGQYKGVEAVDVLRKLDKKEKKQKEKELKAKEAQGQKEESLSMEGLSKK